MQTLNYVSGLRKIWLSRILPAPRMFRWGYVNVEKVLCYFYKVILKNMRESKTSQLCLHTLI